MEFSLDFDVYADGDMARLTICFKWFQIVQTHLDKIVEIKVEETERKVDRRRIEDPGIKSMCPYRGE